MSPRPFISVITIVYNDVKHIEQTINSVLEQEYDNFEYIIIDGGSDDGSSQIIKRHEEKLFFWASEPDDGIADAFNKGLEKSNGDWIIFINSGDTFFSTTVLSEMLLCLDKKYDLVYGKVVLVDDCGGIIKSSGRDFNQRQFLRYMTIPHQACFHKASLFKELGQYDISFKIAMDYEFLLRKKGIEAFFVDILISRMLIGGISQQNEYRVLKEYRRAKLKNMIHGKTKLLVEIEFCFGFAKALVKKVLFR